MDVTNQSLEELTLTVVADDYESLAYVMDSLKTWIADPSHDATVATLAQLVASGYVETYHLSEWPPHCLRVPFSHDDLAALWFYITPAGKDRLKELDKTAHIEGES